MQVLPTYHHTCTSDAHWSICIQVACFLQQTPWIFLYVYSQNTHLPPSWSMSGSRFEKMEDSRGPLCHPSCVSLWLAMPKVLLIIVHHGPRQCLVQDHRHLRCQPRPWRATHLCLTHAPIPVGIIGLHQPDVSDGRHLHDKGYIITVFHTHFNALDQAHYLEYRHPYWVKHLL